MCLPVFLIYWYSLLTWSLLAAVKCRPVLHHCIVIFFWFSEIMHCMLLSIENRVLLMRWGAQWCGIFHYYWWTASNQNKTEASIFPCRLCFLRAFPFISFLNLIAHTKCVWWHVDNTIHFDTAIRESMSVENADIIAFVFVLLAWNTLLYQGLKCLYLYAIKKMMHDAMAI